jgi:hypothetical protein
MPGPALWDQRGAADMYSGASAETHESRRRSPGLPRGRQPKLKLDVVRVAQRNQGAER